MGLPGSGLFCGLTLGRLIMANSHFCPVAGALVPMIRLERMVLKKDDGYISAAEVLA